MTPFSLRKTTRDLYLNLNSKGLKGRLYTIRGQQDSVLPQNSFLLILDGERAKEYFISSLNIKGSSDNLLNCLSEQNFGIESLSKEERANVFRFLMEK